MNLFYFLIAFGIKVKIFFRLLIIFLWQFPKIFSPKAQIYSMFKKFLPFLGIAFAVSSLTYAQDKVISFEEYELDPNSNLLMFNAETPQDGDTLIIAKDADEEIEISLQATIQYGLLSGFEISNVSDASYNDYSHPLAAQPLEGANGTENYAVAFVPVDFMGPDPAATIPVEVKFSNVPENYKLSSISVANQLIAYDYMQQNFAANEFYMHLIVRMYDEQMEMIDSVIFPLADYTGSTGYILEDWEAIDFSEIEENIAMLTFDLVGNDMGQYGLNTPAYFALDEIVFSEIEEEEDPISVHELDANIVKMYPNPTSDYLYFSEEVYHVTVVNAIGQVMIEMESTKELSLKELKAGIYYIHFNLDNGKTVKRSISKIN